MRIFLELIETMKMRLVWEHQRELLTRVKEDVVFSDKNIVKGNNTTIIVDMKIAPEGHILTYLAGEKEPVKGYPDTQSLNAITLYKNFIPLILKRLAHQNWLVRIITLLAIYFNYPVYLDWFDRVKAYTPVMLKEKHYLPHTKEMRRVLKGRLDPRTVDMTTLVLEYDSGYRSRFQDIASELNKNNPPVREIKRLMGLLIERDYKEMGDKWRRIKNLTNILYLMPKTRRLLKEIINDIDISKLKMSKEDIYWVDKMSCSYNFNVSNFNADKEQNKEDNGN